MILIKQVGWRLFISIDKLFDDAREATERSINSYNIFESGQVIDVREEWLLGSCLDHEKIVWIITSLIIISRVGIRA